MAVTADFGGKPMSDREKADAKTPLTRRDLLKGTAYSSLGAALGLGAKKQTGPKVRPVTQVVIVRGKGVLDRDGRVNPSLLEKMLDQGMAALSGEKSLEKAWKRYIRPEDAVGLKVSYMMTPTHPELIESIVRRLTRIGVSKCFAWDRDHKKAEECTALVNVPGMKSHWLSGVAFSIKNYAGAYPRPWNYHADSCANLGAIWNYPPLKGKTRLIIVDALRVLYHGGPQVDPRYLWDYQGLILGADPVAVDVVCLNILQRKRNEINPPEWLLSPPPKHIEVADKKFGLGTSDLKKIKIVTVEV